MLDIIIILIIIVVMVDNIISVMVIIISISVGMVVMVVTVTARVFTWPREGFPTVRPASSEVRPSGYGDLNTDPEVIRAMRWHS